MLTEKKKNVICFKSKLAKKKILGDMVDMVVLINAP